MSWLFSGLFGDGGGGGGSVAATPGYDDFSSPSAVGITVEGRVVGLFRKLPEQTSDCTFQRTRSSEVTVTEWGMQQSEESHRSKRWSPKVSPLKTPENARSRAVSVQSVEHYESLRSSHPEVATLQHDSEKLLGSFGENMVVDGLSSSTVCIGDVFGVPGSKLLLQVASPRCPCSSVDSAHGQMFKGPGVRRSCAGTGRAGWFFRVLRPGALSEGNVLRLQQRPHSIWTVWTIADLFYSTNTDFPYDPRAQILTAAKLDRLEAAVNLKELAEYEWGSWAAKLIDMHKQSVGDDATAAKPQKAKRAARDSTGKPATRPTASGRAGKAAKRAGTAASTVTNPLAKRRAHWPAGTR